MTIVEKIYSDKYNITDKELAEEIIKHPDLTPLDLWLLPQYPFDQWRRKYDYPLMLKNIKENIVDFGLWMTEQNISDEDMLNCYFSDFLEHKPKSKDKTRYLINTTYKGKVTLQSWHELDGITLHNGDDEPIIYELKKKYISYYDWKLIKGENFNFKDTFHRYEPNTPNEQVYLNHNYKLLKMGGIEPPLNSVGILLRGKKLEFVNVSGLTLSGTIYFGSMGNLEFDHCTVDNLKCNELNMPLLDFQNCSVRNIQIRNSYVQQWMFATSETTGNIIDTKLTSIEIYGGQFNPAFTNSDIERIHIEHKKIDHDPNFEKTYRSLSKSAKESGNYDLASDLKISEYDFIRDKTTGFRWLLKSIDKIYWEYGQRPKRLVIISLVVIFLFGLFYSFFPENFKGITLADDAYWKIFYNAEYFSVITFTTLGYGDLSPIGFLKIFASIEAFLGAATMGFLVAGLAKTD